MAKKLLLAFIVIAMATVMAEGVDHRARVERENAELLKRARQQTIQESILRVFRERDAALRIWYARQAAAGAEAGLNRSNLYQTLTHIDSSACPDDFLTAWMAYIDTWKPLAGDTAGLAQREQEDTAFAACRSIAGNYGVRIEAPSTR